MPAMAVGKSSTISARVSAAISGNVRIWKNYLNGYCFNEVTNAIGDAVKVGKQVGHTYGDGHIHSIIVRRMIQNRALALSGT